jgi:hypothetical protein
MDFTFQVLQNIRGIFKNMLEQYALETLNTIPDGFNNNIIWNIGHVVVSEQLLAYKLSGLEPSLSKEMIDKYKKDSKPNAAVSQTEVDEIKGLLHSTIAKTKADYANGVFKNYTAYTVSTTGNTLHNIEEALQFISIHEGLHYGYVLALVKALGA